MKRLLQVCAEVIEEVRNVLAPFHQGQIKCPLIVVGSRLQIRAMRNQQFHNFAVAILRGGVQRRPAALLPGIDVGALVQQQPEPVQFAGLP